VTESFLQWGRTVVNAAAALLEDEIPCARCGTPSSLHGYEALYVHFHDSHVPQPLAVWLYAASEGTAYNVGSRKDVIAVGLKHDANVELDPGAWKFRDLSLFTWQKHVDERWEGFRWLSSVRDLPNEPQAASQEVARRVLAALRRARAIPGPP
jgi:hypothetical protein